MPSIDELLNQQDEVQVLADTPTAYIEIDAESRTMQVPTEYSVFGVVSDEKAERVWFRCPKIVGDNIDLSQIQIRVNYQNAGSQLDQYIVTDIQTSGDNITFSWLLSRKVTAYQGKVSFIVCAVKVSEETITNEWNTTLANSNVLEGLEVTEPEPSEEQSDLISQLIGLMNTSVEESSGYATQAQGYSNSAQQYSKQAQNYVSQAQEYAQQAQKAAEDAQGAVGGVSDYEDLTSKPSIAGITLSGNKALDELGIQPKGNYLTAETDPTVSSWAKSPTKPTYTASEVGADPAGTANTQVSQHNVSETAHNDIRTLIQGIITRLNTLADSDDDTLDQLSEIVTYIKNNKSLIDSITTSKVNVSDIVNDVATNVSNKPLSAAQGVVLKELIDAITVPEKLPSPKSLIIKTVNKGGSSNQVIYDGSQEKSIEISPATLGLDTEEEPTSSGQLTLLKSVGLTSWAQNNSITVDNMSDYDMIGISVISSTGQSPYDVSGIQWYKIPVSGSITHSIMSSTYDRDGMVLEVESRLIQIGTNQITAASKGYYYSWMGVGNDETHAVPYEIYGMKF